MPPTSPMLPDGLRIYAIGDLHGRFDLLETMADKIRDDLRASPPAERAVEIFIGDYIDRGPQSREVVEWLIETAPLGHERICLLGNHEDMLLEALADPSGLANWLFNGGDATLVSYGVTALPSSPPAMHAACVAAIPPRHRAFLSALPRTAEFGSYFFVHAGINPSRRLYDQDPQDLIWIRGPFHISNADFGRIVVHGHTPVVEPDIRTNRINIDTGAVFTGRLTCLVLEGAGRRLLEARSE
ncbi:MAG: metallophosphoesterase family protein [Propylenella sp.]